MNILFVTNKNVYPLIGGIERITYSVAEALRNIYGLHCYSLYTQENKLEKTTTDVFEGKVCLRENNQVNQLAAYIKQNNINVVIAQGSDVRVNVLMPQLREAVNQCSGVKLLFVYHQMPSFELVPMDCSTLWHRLIHGNKKAALRQLLIQALPSSIAASMVRSKYVVPFEKADKVVLLSNGFIEQYNRFVNGDRNHYSVIHNMLSFPSAETKEMPKQNEVLVVSRLDEKQKRIKSALQAWRKAYQPDWKLRIVGYGEDMSYYQSLAQKWQLQNITFEGLQNPFSYYQKASIFLMVSAYEGWGLTITEAQQCGCVPIAFDSFGAIHDIINSEKNGIIVPEGDIDEYAAQLKRLMNNPDELRRMSENARKDCMRFSRENIAKQWKTLLETL